MKQAIIDAINTDVGVLTEVFVRAIATPSHPIVLFLDDLQWADELSLQLICTLAADTEINNFLFIGSYRDNEIDDTHPLTTQLYDLKRKEVAIIDIHVECMSKDD
eukprot:5366989-Ditylum_brightwellii.AAC.1